MNAHLQNKSHRQLNCILNRHQVEKCEDNEPNSAPRLPSSLTGMPPNLENVMPKVKYCFCEVLEGELAMFFSMGLLQLPDIPGFTPLKIINKIPSQTLILQCIIQIN